MTYEKAFIAFLKKNRAYKKFMANLNVAFPNKTIKEHIDYCLKIHIRFIGAAFSWEDTPEGYNYWAMLSIKWVRFLIKTQQS